MTKAELRRALRTGERYRVTNHYITREDHPCYGTNVRTVAASNGGSFSFDVGGRVPWALVSRIEQRGDVIDIYGHPTSGALFLTLELA